MTPPISMREAALAVGLSYDRFRKAWPDMVRDAGFPCPILGTRWDPEAVSAWKVARSARRLVIEPPAAAMPAGANHDRLRAQLAAARRA
jgi:hypothetical protein